MNVRREIKIESNKNLIWRILSNINQYSRWNPHITNAAIYGTFEKNNDIKMSSGEWEFKFRIIETVVEHGFYLSGETTGVNIDFKLKIDDSGSDVIITAEANLSGWIAVIFKKKIRQSASDFLGLFLSSLKAKAELGVLALDKYPDERSKKSENDSFSMPTPFNIVYKSGTRSKRKKLE